MEGETKPTSYATRKEELMFGLVKWWLHWLVQGLKLLVLVAAASAAAGAIYMGWEFVSVLHPGYRNVAPDTARTLSTAWDWFGHSVQLAMFTFVLVNWFPEAFPQVARGQKASDDE